ncbi:IS3 family transposase [Chitinophaga oryzae]|uniref:IS3 family transposase n=1 Tax=Chitinophaga oryzae TaxID=2725414 RepID=A0AAE6ZND3_9BACT|nr:IS3 family transposase [Chitinophaga oryzae]QJB35924.1 IS3 family transposase [Chitinophaga oryzae]
MPAKQRLDLIDCNHPVLSISRQCKIFSIHRSAVYYKPAEESSENLTIMRVLDEQYMRTPFYGVKRLRVVLAELGYIVNPKRLRRLMRTIGWQTAYCKPRTSRPDPIALKYPYLLTGLQVTRSNQVWSIDITYVPMRDGFMYLCAIIDVYSRYVVGWGINNYMSAEWCAGIVQNAVAEHGKPEIINSDQGSTFTADAYTKAIKRLEVRISMDGKGRAIDNIFIERLWRTIKYEHLYLHNYDTVISLVKGLRRFFLFYNEQRIHQSLDYKTPIEIYKECNRLKPLPGAALTKSVTVSSDGTLSGGGNYGHTLCQSPIVS